MSGVDGNRVKAVLNGMEYVQLYPSADSPYEQTFSGTLQSFVAGAAYINVANYGVVGDGVTDNTTGIQSAISAASTMGGANIVFGDGIYLTGPLSVTSKGVKLIGQGNAQNTANGGVPSTILKYNGSAGGTILTVSSVSGASNLKITDCAVSGIALDGNSSAAIGLLVSSVNASDFNVAAYGCTTVQIKWDVVASLLDARDSQYNRVSYMRALAAGTANGILFDTVTLGANISFNNFGYLWAQHVNGYGIRIGNCDNNIFQFITCQRPSGSGVGLILGAADGVTANQARSNAILECSPGSGGITAQGTETATLASGPNTLLYLDKANAAADPTIGTAALLAWGTNKNTMGQTGFFSIGVALSSANAILATSDAIGAVFPMSIVAGGGKHIRLHNGTTGIWGINIAASNGDLNIARASGTGAINFPTVNMGFNSATAIAKPTVSGSRGSNDALASLLTALANYGLIVDGSS